MKTLMGSKKEGAILKETKTWGFIVVDYINLSDDGRPMGFTYKIYSQALDHFNKLINSKK